VAAVVASGAPSVPARAGAATTRFESADHRVALELPADWKVETIPSDHSLLSLRAAIPPDGAPLRLDLYHQPGFRDERCQAYLERTSQVEMRDGAQRGEVLLQPSPHLVMTLGAPEEYPFHAWIYRVIDRNGFSLAAQCPPETWPLAKEGCFAAAKSLTSTIPEWPTPPEGYAVSEREGYEVYAQPGVSEDDVAALVAAVLDLEKKYAKAHAPVPKPRANRPQIVVSVDVPASLAAAISPDGRDDYFASEFHGRLYAVPLKKDAPAASRARLASAATGLFHQQCYGQLASSWLASGEKRLAASEALRGWPLPVLADETRLPKTMATFEKLVREPGRDAAEQATAYVAVFRTGAKPWRDAFAAFLKDLAATGDWETAEKTRLLSLDQEKLRAAAQAWVDEKRPPKTK
jgi:hypothetical protein